MKYRFLLKKGIAALIAGLLKEFKVYGPVKKACPRKFQAGNGFPMYGNITAPGDLNLLHSSTHISPKQYLFPQRETLLRFSSGECPAVEPVVEAEEQALFGVHPCDIHAIKLLDRVFAYGTADTNYLKRREKTIIIGSNCIPDKYCFCKGVNTMTVESGFDLFLHNIGTGFLVESGTQKGKKLLLKYTKTRKANQGELKKLSQIRNQKKEMFVTSINADASTLPLIYSGSYNSPVWERIGSICYGCGSCNLVCPTCYCFDVRDDIKLNLKKGERYRVWDGCMLEDFAKVAGGPQF